MIKGNSIEVNSDAPTMLKVMGLMNGEPGIQEILDVFDLMFPEKSKKELSKLKLNFQDLVVVIQEAVSLISGDGKEPRGE